MRGNKRVRIEAPPARSQLQADMLMQLADAAASHPIKSKRETMAVAQEQQPFNQRHPGIPQREDAPPQQHADTFAAALRDLSAALGTMPMPVAGLGIVNAGSDSEHAPQSALHLHEHPVAGMGPALATGANDQLAKFADLPPPMLMLTTTLLETQQRVFELESAAKVTQEQILVQYHIAATVRRTIRALVTQWKDLVMRMRMGLADHDAGLKQLKARIEAIESAPPEPYNGAAKVAVLEFRVEQLEAEGAALRKELESLHGALAEAQEAGEDRREGVLKIVAPYGRTHGSVGGVLDGMEAEQDGASGGETGEGALFY